MVWAYPIYGGPSTITISATVGDIPSTPSSGGGGGGKASSSSSANDTSTTMPTIVNFSGMAYPSSKVTLLSNGKISATTVADSNARFSVSLKDLKTGTYNFSIYGQDLNGIKSLTFSFPVYVTYGTTVNIDGIFLSPTINTDKSEVKKGDNILVFGQTVPNTDLGIIFHSDQEILKNTRTDSRGLYSYNMNTNILEYGDHIVKSRAKKEETVFTSNEAPFIVGLVSKLNNINKTITSSPSGDINNDNKVNLVDFSVTAYWYKKSNPPASVDLNGDGKVNLVDFSIMAFNWTG